MIWVRLVSLVLSGVFPQFIFAQDAAAAAPTTPIFGGLVQVSLALLVVIGAIAATAWLLRRFGPAHIAGGGVMRIVGGVMLSQRERLVLVEVGETWLVIGVAPGQVRAVHSMPRPPQSEIDAVKSATMSGFGDRLKEAWRKRSGA